MNDCEWVSANVALYSTCMIIVSIVIAPVTITVACELLLLKYVEQEMCNE